MRRLVKLMMAAMLSVCMLAGCSAKRLLVLYTSDPIGWLLQRIGGETVDAESIQTGGTLQQDASLKDDAIDLMANADVLFHFGQTEPYLSKDAPIIRDTETDIVDLCAGNTIYEFKRYTKKTGRDGKITWDKGPWYEGTVFQKADMMERDDCLWNDPVAMMGAAETVKEWLCDHQSRYASRYEAAWQSLRADLIRMDEAWQALADQNEAGNRRTAFAVISDSWTCMQKSYDMEVYPIVLSRRGELPDEAQITLIEDRLRKDDVHWILEESSLNDAQKMLYERIAEDCDLQRASIHDLSSITEEENSAGSDYLSLMYDNMDTLEAIAEDREQ